MTKIYLIRHAEAEGNLYRRIHGHYDGGITPKGHRQIALLAERFREVGIDAVYASDLQRTQITAGAILQHHPLPLNIEPGLKEVGLGVWEDVPWGNVGFDSPKQMLYFSNDPAKWDIPGGEPFYALRARVTDAITRLAEKHPNQTITCFSHGMAIRAFISGLMNVPSERISEVLHGDNTCVASLNYENGVFTVDYYNDNSHLPAELSTFAGQKWWREKDRLDYFNFRIVPAALPEDAERYLDCYRESWQSAHGTLEGFSETPYLREAERVSKDDPHMLMKALSRDSFAGFVALDPARAADEAGWVSFLYLAPEFRGMGMGAQLLGHAVSVYRRLGRNALRLHVAEDNASALSFYNKLGFACVGTEPGMLCPLRVLELKL